MARPTNTTERREQIVDALLSVIAERGYADATVAAIAAQAGLAAGLVHYHFRSKHEVLVALVETLAARLRGRVQARGNQPAEPLARLLAMLDAYVGLGPDADPRAVAAWVVIGAEAVRDAGVRDVFQGAVVLAVADLEAATAAALAATGQSTERAGTIARTLYAAIEGCYRLAAGAPCLIEVGSAAPMLREAAAALLGERTRPAS